MLSDGVGDVTAVDLRTNAQVRRRASRGRFCVRVHEDLRTAVCFFRALAENWFRKPTGHIRKSYFHPVPRGSRTPSLLAKARPHRTLAAFRPGTPDVGYFSLTKYPVPTGGTKTRATTYTRTHVHTLTRTRLHPTGAGLSVLIFSGRECACGHAGHCFLPPRTLRHSTTSKHVMHPNTTQTEMLRLQNLPNTETNDGFKCVHSIGQVNRQERRNASPSSSRVSRRVKKVMCAVLIVHRYARD